MEESMDPNVRITDRSDAQTDTLPGVAQVDPSTAVRKVRDEGALLVDVRERHEVDTIAFGLSAVVPLPMSELERRFAELPRDRELILACAVGRRSHQAASYLMAQGYAHVANLAGGIVLWSREGLPVTGRAGGAVAPDAGGCGCDGTAEEDGCGCSDSAEAVPAGSGRRGSSAGSSSCC